MMRYYKNTNTGEVFSTHELHDLFKMFGYDMKYESFEDFVEDSANLQPVYIAIHVGGENDGEIIYTDYDESPVVNFAYRYTNAHEDDPDFLGVSIYDTDGDEVLNW